MLVTDAKMMMMTRKNAQQMMKKVLMHMSLKVVNKTMLCDGKKVSVVKVVKDKHPLYIRLS